MDITTVTRIGRSAKAGHYSLRRGTAHHVARNIAVSPVAIRAGVGHIVGDGADRFDVAALRCLVGGTTDLDQPLFVLLPVGRIDWHQLAVLAPAPRRHEHRT